MGSRREGREGKRGEGSGARGRELKATKNWPLEKSGPSITKKNKNKNKKTVAKERPKYLWRFLRLIYLVFMTCFPISGIFPILILHNTTPNYE